MNELLNNIHLLLLNRASTISTAESCTGGELGALLTSQAGASHYFMGGIIAYQNNVKTELLGVPPELINSVGAVSPQVAEAMADGVRSRLGSEIGIGTTGILGPGGGSAAKPVGTFYAAITSPSHQQRLTLELQGSRQENRRNALEKVCTALEKFLQTSTSWRSPT